MTTGPDIGPRARLGQLGIELPEVRASAAWTSPTGSGDAPIITPGQLPVVDGVLAVKGRLGDGISVRLGAYLARTAALNALAVLHQAVGLDEVERVIRVAGHVASVDGFADLAAVVDGASGLVEEVFGERGRHVRTAVRVERLPLGSPVEIQLYVTIRL